MNKLSRLFTVLILPLAILGWLQACALADGGGAAAPSLTDPLPLPAGWAGLALVLLTVASWGVRKLSTKSAFFHTTGGAALMGTLTAVLPAAIQAIQSHGLQLISIETAVLGAVLSFVASDNASNSPAVQAAIVEAKTAAADSVVPTSSSKLGLLFPFVGIAFVMSLAACPAHTGTPTGSGDGGVSTSSKYTAAFEACLVSDGIKLGLSDGSSVLNVLEDGTLTEAEIESKLEALGITTGGNVVASIGACAVSSWFSLNPVTAKAPVTPAQAAVRVFYARHPNMIRK